MSELARHLTRYPTASPIYDISGFLAPGVVTVGNGTSCWAWVSENLLMVSVRVNPSAATGTDRNIAIGLPEQFWPSINTPDTAQQELFLMRDGRIWLRSTADWTFSDRAEVNALFIAPRGS